MWGEGDEGREEEGEEGREEEGEGGVKGKCMCSSLKDLERINSRPQKYDRFPSRPEGHLQPREL